MKTKLFIILNIGLLITILAHSIFRDIQLEKRYCWDLRNRVVGARLQKDGKLPYFYHWAPEDGLRYYDPFNMNLEGPSNITASPFFHQLLYPVCDLPEETLSKLWLWFQYILLVAMALLMTGLARTPFQKLIVINTAIIFTCTEAWKYLIATGQSYLVLSFLMTVIFLSLYRHTKKTLLAAAVCIGMFVLMRPIALIFFIPYFFQYKKYVRFVTCSLVALVLYGFFVLCSPFEKAIWKNYYDGLKAQVGFHQGKNPAVKIPDRERPGILQLEGINIRKVEKIPASTSIIVYNECGSAFILYQLLTHRWLPLPMLYLMLFFVLFMVTGVYYVKRERLSTLQIILFSFVLYMIVEFFSPVTRHQYNTVQWLPLLMAGFLLVTEWRSPAFLLLMAGFVLTIFIPLWLPMRQTIGEFLWACGLLLIALSSSDKRHA